MKNLRPERLPYKKKLEDHFYLSTKVGIVHVNMNANADKETFNAVQNMVELAYKYVKK